MIEMEEIIKHINDTNASYRTIGAGDAKNTDLFLDAEHFDLFKGSGEQVRVRFSKENLCKAILFIASILPRKYDNSSIHKTVSYSDGFVYEQLELLDGFFMDHKVPISHKVQSWKPRKDVPKKNGEIDNRFYFNELIEEFNYTNSKGQAVSSKFTIRNYLAGGYSDLHIKRADDGIFDVWISNVLQPHYNEKKVELLDLSNNSLLPLQQITYGAPGTGKSYSIDEDVKKYKMKDLRTTFHPDSDYSTFVGAYKPQMEKVVVRDDRGFPVIEDGKIVHDKKIIYKYSRQAFLKAYIASWQDLKNPHVLVIEEINRGNCAQIFGDLFQLLDRNDKGLSSYPITPDADIMQELNDAFEGLEVDDVDAVNALYKEDVMADVLNGSKLLLPNNLYIWATMNTSDQSLFPIDSAFKRRWDWKYVPISNAQKGWAIAVNGVRYDWWLFVEKINQKIWDATHSEDKKLGYFFCKADKDEKIISADKFVGKVLFYIYNDVFKDYGFDDDIFKDENDQAHPELLFKDYFKADGKPYEPKIQVFLKNLGVKAEGKSIVESETTTDAPEEYTDEVNEDIETQGNDNTKYAFDGIEGLGKGQLAVRVIEKFMGEHPDYTLAKLQETFPDEMMGNELMLKGLVVKAKDLEQEPYSSKKKAYGYFKAERKYKSADEQEFFVSNNWNNTNVQTIIDFAKGQGWDIIPSI